MTDESLNKQSCDTICHVGYALNAKKLRRSGQSVAEGQQGKWFGGGLADIVCGSSQHVEGVVFHPWNHETPLAQQPEYHIIIHKLTEDILMDQDGRKLKELKDYLKRYPKTVIIDPIEAVQIVLSRSHTCERLQNVINIKKSNFPYHCPFAIPKFIVWSGESMAVDDIQRQLVAADLVLPVICKPIEACGTPASHQLVVVVDIEGLSLVKFPCLIQQYYNHNAKLYKVYVIDKDVMVFERPSLPDLVPNLSEMKSVAFDSSANYPTIQHFLRYQDVSKSIETNHSDLHYIKKSIDVSPDSAFYHTATSLAEGFGLSLFGFDAIIVSSDIKESSAMNGSSDSLALDDSNSSSFESKWHSNDIVTQSKAVDESKLVVIDVNYFPSFKEVEDFPERLRAFFRRKAGLAPFKPIF